MDSCIGENEYNRFIEDDLSIEELRILEVHLKECKNCEVEFKGWQVLKKSLSSRGEIEIPKTLKVKVMNEVRKERILPKTQSLEIRTIMIAGVLLLLLTSYLLHPIIKPYIGVFTKEAVSYLSELFYSIISFVGLDMKSVMTVFKALLSLFNQLFWMFALSTAMLIVGFFSLILIGRVKLKLN